ncbi:hypothetical protein [uncultured Cytophaga sp.]|uniref:hypothetical protein n=1 Tax=uncultured Cytophaga sp. TaxID=160238 RepID=UPI00262D5250|nr:hypothetical protein [uncultured Cytophaga sp.]
MLKHIIILMLIGGFWCCKDAVTKEEIRIVTQRTLSYSDSMQIRIDSLLKKSYPIMGYRFIITGDFNGDHKQDTLIEHYTDSLKIKEVAKYDSTFDYFDSWFVAERLNKKSFLSNKNNSVTEITGGILGFSYIENCGDITGDGFDDLFVVPHRGGASNCVDGNFYTFKNNAWKQLWNIPVWQWQFPPTPNASMQPGLFGSFDVGMVDSDSINHLLENQLKTFHFIKHHPDKSFEYECRNPLDFEYPDDSTEEEEQKYILKRFSPVTIDKKLYLQDLQNKNTYYGNVTHMKSDNQWMYVFPYYDYAEIFLVRKYYN